MFSHYDLIIWNRDGISERDDGSERVFSFNKTFDRKRKYYLYFQYCIYVRQILRRKMYDLVVFPHSQIGVVLSLFLKKYYNHRYIADIRDYEYEHVKLYKKLEEIYIKHSTINIISSEAYKTFLPEAEYNVLHNDRTIPENYLIEHDNYNFRGKICIGNIGTFRFYDNNISLINGIKNNRRFVYKVCGRGSEKLEAYVKSNSIDNVSVKGTFDFSETLALYASCNAVFNLYGNNNPEVKLALSNKLYIAARFRMPILVCPNTFMSQEACKYGFGIVVDLNADDIAEQIIAQYEKLMLQNYKLKCNEFVEHVELENRTTLEKLCKAVSEVEERGN